MGPTCATSLGRPRISRFSGRTWVFGPVLDCRVWFSALGPPRWWKTNPDYVASNASYENDSGSILRSPDRFYGFGSVPSRRAEIFDHRTARDFPIGDSPQNGPYTVQNGPLGVSEQGQIRVSLESMASSSGNLDSLVELRFHDFRTERMRHWWTLLGGDDHASIVGVFGKFSSLMWLRVDHGLLEALASFWDPTHYCFSIGEVDLVPTLEEYARLLQLDSPFSEMPIIPVQGPRSNRVLEKYLGLNSAVLRPEISHVGETWQKANISLDLLTKYFFWSDFPAELAGDFIAGKRGWKEFWANAFKITFAGIFLFPTSVGRIDLGETGKGGPDVLHIASSTLVLQSPAFGGVQYPPRLGDLSLVTFDYVPGDDMWRSLSWVESIWGSRCSEMVLVEGGLHADSSVTPDFVKWREGWSPSFTLRPTIRPGVSYASVPPSLRASASTGWSERVAVLERELEEDRAELSSLRLAKASEGKEFAARVESMRSTLHHSNASMANLRRDLEAQRGNVSTLRAMNDFIREQLEISKAAKDHLEQTLAETQGQLETEARAVLEEHDEGDPALSTALGRFCRETCIRLGH
uniref:DUF7745 domain-containing protein n=1 Tax=Fagus sylvatica TaxID=28930 RepID=A0A2N9IFM5_FAGSY